MTATAFAKAVVKEVLSDPHVNDHAQEFVQAMVRSSEVQRAVSEGLVNVLQQPETQAKTRDLVVVLLQSDAVREAVVALLQQVRD